MAFSSSDLASVEGAILDLALGKRVVSVDIQGKTRAFQAVDLEKLLRLRDLIRAEIDPDGVGNMVNKVQFGRPA